MSRRFIRASARKLRELSDRRLESYDLVALMLDGKTFAEDEMVVTVGVTITGEKVLLGFVVPTIGSAVPGISCGRRRRVDTRPASLGGRSGNSTSSWTL